MTKFRIPTQLHEARIRIPTHLQDTAREIGAMKWAKDKRFPRLQWFETITNLQESLAQLTGNSPLEYESLVQMIAIAINVECSLSRHALKLGIAISSAEVWAKMCTAAAWVLLVEYLGDAAKGVTP